MDSAMQIYIIQRSTDADKLFVVLILIILFTTVKTILSLNIQNFNETRSLTVAIFVSYMV